MSEPQQQPYQQQAPSLDGAPQGHPGAGPQFTGQQPPAFGNPGQAYPGQSYPGQSYPGQSYPGQSYPNAGYPGQGYSGPARPAASGKALGRTALIVALIAFGIGVLGSFLFPILSGVLQYGYGLGYGIVNGVISFLVLVGSVIALILGLIAIRRPGSPILAGIAIGIAASEIAATVVSWISSLFYTFV